MSLIDEGLLRVLLSGQMRRISKSGDRFVIGGYASVLLEDEKGNEIGDLENESVDLDALDEAFTRMMSIKARRNLMAHHSNTQIGELLENYTDSEGTMWKSYVVRIATPQYPRKGLFIISELFRDIQEGKRYIKSMMGGDQLSFSIGGEILRRSEVCDGGKCISRIVMMDLAEVSSCQMGMNPEARAFVMKGAETPSQLKSANSGAELLSKLRV